MAKLYLYSPSSGLFSCPLAMTDGAAKIAEVFQDFYTHQSFYTECINILHAVFT